MLQTTDYRLAPAVETAFSEADIARAFSLICAQGFDFADIYAEHTLHESWHLEENTIKNGTFTTRAGAGVRAVAGAKTAFAAMDGWQPEALFQAARTVRAIGRQGQSRAAALHSVPQTQHLYSAQHPSASWDAAQKVALLHKVNDLARAADSRIKDVIVSLTASYGHILLARLDGRMHRDVRPMVRLSLTVFAEENGRREQGSAGGGGRTDIGFFSEEVLAQYVRTAVSQAVVNLSAVAAPAGAMTVVLGSGWPGVLLHEAVGHGLEGDFNRKGTSVFSGRIGEQVAARGVTVIDQGNIPGRRGSLNIDDEGNPTQATVLIEDGILRGYLQDETNARLMHMQPTGNGRRESYAHAPMPRMTNTFMQNGTYSPQEIIASVKRGIYAVNFGGGQVDITSGQFVFGASEAWLIENGRLVHPIKGAMIAGNGAEVMRHIGMIGNDLALDSGVGICGKEGQSVPVGVGQPTIRIDAGLVVGGAEAA